MKDTENNLGAIQNADQFVARSFVRVHFPQFCAKCNVIILYMYNNVSKDTHTIHSHLIFAFVLVDRIDVKVGRG